MNTDCEPCAAKIDSGKTGLGIGIASFGFDDKRALRNAHWLAQQLHLRLAIIAPSEQAGKESNSIKRDERRRLLNELGGIALVTLILDDEESWTAIESLHTALLDAGHLVLIHFKQDTLPKDIRDRSAIIRDWGRLDQEERQERWLALGGTGQAPNETHPGRMHALAAAQRLGDLGLKRGSDADVLI